VRLESQRDAHLHEREVTDFQAGWLRGLLVARKKAGGDAEVGHLQEEEIILRMRDTWKTRTY